VLTSEEAYQFKLNEEAARVQREKENLEKQIKMKERKKLRDKENIVARRMLPCRRAWKMHVRHQIRRLPQPCEEGDGTGQLDGAAGHKRCEHGPLMHVALELAQVVMCNFLNV
jgi:hypothetical protein